MPAVTQFTIAYGAGLWIGLVALVPEWAIAGLALAAVLVMPRHGWSGVLCGAAALGVLGGSVRGALEARTCGSVWRPGPQAAVLRIHDAPGMRATTTATVEHSASRCGGTLRLALGAERPAAGTRVLVVGMYREHGVFRVSHMRRIAGRPSRKYEWRDALLRRARALYGPRAGLAEALVLDRRDDVPPALRQDFADSGLAHLLAISGMHVGMLAGWVVLVAGWLGLRPWRWILGAIASWLYVALLGFPAPATRAAAYLALHALGRLRQRHPPPAAALATSVVVVLQVDPAAATSVGAWLSVAAVWGTAAGVRVVPRRWRRRPLVQLVASSCGAILATAPITALAFGAVAPIGVAANLVAVPLSAVAVPGLVGSLAFGDLFAGGTGLAFAGIERTAHLAAQVPGGHLTGPPGVAFAVPWILLAAVVVFLVRSGRAWVHRARLPLSVVAATSWLLVAVGVWNRAEGRGTLAVHVLAVGQGDAIAIRSPGGSWVLVDGGPRTATSDAGRSVVLPFLRRQGVRSVAAVILTHGDADHLGGIPSILRFLDAGLVVDPAQPLGTPLYLEYLTAVEAGGMRWQSARVGDTIVLDSVQLAVLHPSAEWVDHQLEANENSVVLHLRYGCFDALLMGDAGRPVEEALRGRIGPVEVLKVGHHGSSSATTAAWLDAVRPQTAVISVGRNRYGHPEPEILERLAEHGARIWRTDRGGTVTVRTDGRYYWVEQAVPTSLAGSVRCRMGQLLRSSGSSWSRRDCTRKPPVISPTCSTTSPSLPR